MSVVDQVRIESSARRVRVMLGGEYIADTSHPLLVWEIPYFPFYYIPVDDVRSDCLLKTGESRSSSLGEATVFTVSAGGREAVGAAVRHDSSPMPELKNSVGFNWKAMDHWFEEDEEIFAHARDPHHRVDALRSSRQVRVEVDGVTVADSTSPVLLFETGLPTRYYFPKTDVRMDLLTSNDESSQCPYKGIATYWSLDTGKSVHPNLVWSYPFPITESAKIAGLVCFYNEKVDLFVDGLSLERPLSPFTG